MVIIRERQNMLLVGIGDKDIDLEFWGGKEKVDGICLVGCQE